MHVMGSVSPANEREAFSFHDEGVAAVMPPPPPPPLPPPPPPPPLFPGPGELGGHQKKKKRVRSFFWKTIPEEQVKGRPNLWTRGPTQQQYQIDVQTVEELFGQSDCQSETKAPLGRGGRGRSSLREAKEEVSILDPKRGMNIGIFLKQFKKSTQTIVEDVCNGNSEPYGAGPLRELLKLLPDAEEVKKLEAFRGDVSRLSMADAFLYQLVLLPSYSVRIESMLLKEEFPAACEAMTRDIAVLRRATEELMCCDELHAVLHLVLQAGNILNAGGYAGNAVGFKLSSLLSLADTKANKPGMNLLHFVALEAQKKDEKLLEFPLKLTHIQAAARISLETLDTELQWMTSRTRSVEESVQRDTQLLQQLDTFLQSATASLCSLRHSRQQLRRDGSELMDFFCEDRDAFRLDDCFAIFRTFCSRFADAVKENVEREAKEAARRRRLQQLEEQKRHSWAGGEEVVGAFRLHCSESDMAQHDKAGLLMKPHPHSPHSPPGHWGSSRRSRKSPSSSPSFAAERDLSTFLEMGSHGRKVAPRDARAALSLASSASELTSPGPSHQARPQSPKVTMFNFAQSQQPQLGRVAARPSPWSLKNANAHEASGYLSCEATQAPVDVTNATDEVPAKPTSDGNQQFDHNNNGGDQHHPDPLADRRTPSGLKGEPGKASEPDPDLKRGTMSVVVETCTLVPELKMFGGVAQTSCDDLRPPSRLRGRDQGDAVAPDKRSVQDSGHTGRPETPDVESSLSPRREDEGGAGKVVVWCVTGVCKAAGEVAHAADAQAQTEQDQCRSDGRGGRLRASSVAASSTPSEAEPAKVQPVPGPISSQPVPVSRCDDLSHQVSSLGWSPTKPESASAGGLPAVATGASDEGKQEDVSRREDGETLLEQSTDHQNQNNEGISGENTELASDAKAELSTSSKLSARNLRATKTQPSRTKAAPTASPSKPVRTLTSSESQDMRRVVPISRTGRSFSSTGKRRENSPGHHQGPSSTTALTSLSSSSLRQRERPSTAPSSRRSSINKTPDSNQQKVSGPGASPQKQDQRRPCTQQASAKPRPQPEEKMCRSTLRALTLAAAGSGGRGSVSAPATPLHKGTTHPSSPLPGFARSTASSSFRRIHSPPQSESSPRPGAGSTPFIRTGSLRAPVASRSSDVLNPPSSLKRSQSIKVRPSSPPNSSSAPPKGHQQNDSGSFSDKSTHSRDSGRTSRPSWR